MSERIDVPLPDGRNLDVEVSGPDSDPVLLWHHGTPGTSAQPSHIREEAHERGLRLVTYTRAGGGTSTRNKGRSVADVAADMDGVLDHLGVARCISAGGSGGGPHALATGALLPERVVAVISVAGARPYGEGFLDGMGQDNIEEFSMALQGEDALRPFLDAHRDVLADARAEDVISQLESLLPEPDLAVLTGELGEEIAANFREGHLSVNVACFGRALDEALTNV